MTIPDRNGKGKSADLEIPRALAKLGVPVWHAKLNRQGGPVRDGWQDITADTNDQEIASYRPGMAMCATAGVVFDIIDRDPKNDPGTKNWHRFISALGDGDPDFYLKVATPSGGMHYYIPTLGLGRKYNPIPGYPGVDLQAEKSLVFLPPTVRKGGTYSVVENSLSAFDPTACGPLRKLIVGAANAAPDLGSGGRAETSELRRAVIDAEAGEQRQALLRLVYEYEKRGYEREDIILLLLQLKIQNYDSRRPWRSADFRSLLHTPGRVIPDASPGELDGIDGIEPVRSEEISQAQKHANMLALIRARAQLYTREVLGRESVADFVLPSVPSLSDDLMAPRPSVVWAVENLATAGAQVTLPSSRKTGKTTFLLNLCRSAGNGTPFLDRFDCSMDGNIGYINAEMLRADILGYVDRLGSGIWTSRVRMRHCREDGTRINLLNDSVCESVVKWLVADDIEWLVMDPWKNFLAWSGAGMNDNDAVLLLSDRCRSIAVSAGLQLVIIPMHTTQTPAEEGMERGKGAGELEDGADWLWRYIRTGGSAEPRTLSAEGRGPGVDEMVVSWDASTGLLSSESGLTRASVRRSSGADRAVEVLSLLLIDGAERAGKQELISMLHGSKQERLASVRAAIVSGAIVETVIASKKWLSLGGI